MADLSGSYKSLVWFARGGVAYRPGTLVVLTHEEAVRALEDKTAMRLTQEEADAVNEAPAKEPEPVLEPVKPEPQVARTGTGPRRGRGGDQLPPTVS